MTICSSNYCHKTRSCKDLINLMNLYYIWKQFVHFFHRLPLWAILQKTLNAIIQMFLRNKALAINSTLIVISTTILGTILHELSHYLVALKFGLNPELHHNYVSYQTSNVSEIRLSTVAGIGPIFSLITGILFLLISINLKKVNLLKLFTLWFGMNGIIMFLGYLLIAPFAKNGDTGKVFSYLGLPSILTIIIAVISFIVTIKLFKSLSNQFIFYNSSINHNQKDNIQQLFTIPLIVSTTITTILNFPVITWLSLLPTIFMPMTYISTLKQYQKLKLYNAKYLIDKTSIVLLTITLICISVFIYLK